VRTDARVTLGGAERFHRTVAEGEVDLAGGPARGFGGKTRPGKEALGDTVVATVFLENGRTTSRELTLAAVPCDESELLERAEVGEGRRRTNTTAGRDLLQARAPHVGLASADHPEGLDLPMGQLLQDLHGDRDVAGVYIGYPNY